MSHPHALVMPFGSPAFAAPWKQLRAGSLFEGLVRWCYHAVGLGVAGRGALITSVTLQQSARLLTGSIIKGRLAVATDFPTRRLSVCATVAELKLASSRCQKEVLCDFHRLQCGRGTELGPVVGVCLGKRGWC